MKRDNKILILVIAPILFIVGSCSPRVSNNFLAFFFDGVTGRDTIKTSLVSGDSSKISNPGAFRSDPLAENSSFSVHYPYKEKDCSSCHDPNNKIELILKQPDLCYSCHDDFSKTYKYVHGPVVSGYCTACHNPHMAKEKKLLIRSGQQLCLFCHESKAVLKNSEHKDIADTECTLCHNPHGGENIFILN
jgi:predicted CXXCH cytochrome family protein